MNRTARRTLFTLAAAALALPAAAQTGYYGNPGPSFTAMSNGEMEQKRTAELLAGTQRSNTAAVPNYVPAGKPGAKTDERLLVTRRDSNVTLPYTTTDSVPPPSGYSSGYQVATTVAVPPPAQAAYANSYSTANLNPQAIPAMPDARPGECFALVRVPERFRSYQKEYELRAASERIQTLPPRYENMTEQYVAQEAYERLETIPATFKIVTEQVEIAAPSSRYVSTEPIYETVSEQVLEQPARTVWKRGSGPISRIDNATGDIMCLVEEPAIYKTVTRRVLKTPASVQEVPVPGQTGLVSRRVIDQPAQVRRVVVPEQIAVRTVRRLVEPGQVQRIAIPAQTATTTVRELESPARLEWRSVLCETNMTPENIRRVQEALAREGFDPGSNSGRLDAQTINALNAYQRAHNLPEDRYMNMDSIHALGVM